MDSTLNTTGEKKLQNLNVNSDKLVTGCSLIRECSYSKNTDDIRDLRKAYLEQN